MTEDPPDDIEELWKGESEQTRTNTTATAGDGDAVDRVEAITDALLAIQDGEGSDQLNVRDERLRAVLEGLETAGELRAASETLAEYLDADAPEDVTRSTVARQLMRVGLQAGLPEIYEDGVAATKQAMLERANEL